MAYDIGPRIGIDGEAEFRKSIQDINESLKTLGTEMKVVASEYDKGDKSAEALVSRNEVLTKQIDAQRKKLEELNKGLSASSEKYGENDKVTQGWQRAVNQATADLNKMERELKSNTDTIKDANKPTEELSDNLEDVGKSAESAGTKTLTLGDIIKGNLISSAIISGVKKLASTLKDFAMDGIEIAASTGEIEAAYEQVMGESAGYADEKLKQLSGTTGAVTSRLKEDFTTQTASWTGLGKTVEEATDLASRSIGVAADYAAMYGMTAEDASERIKSFMNGNLGAAESLGISASAAGIAAWATKELGVDYNKLEESEKKVIRLKFAETMAENAGITGQASRESENYANVMSNMSATVDKLKGRLAENLLPVILEVTQKVTEFISELDTEALENTIKNIADAAINFLGWILDNGEVIISLIAGVGAAMLAWNVVTMIQGVVGAIKAFRLANEGATIAQYALNLAMNLNPVGIIVTAIAGLVAAIGILWATNDKFRENVTGIFKKIKEGALDLVDSIKTFFTVTIPESLGKFMNFLKENWAGLLLLIVNPFAGAFKLVYDNCETFRNFIDKFVHKIKTLITTLFKNMVDGIVDLPSKFSEIGSSTVNGLWNAISNLTSWIGDKVKGFGKGIVLTLSSGLVGMAEIGRNLVQGLWNGISNATDWIVDKVKGFGGSVLSAIKGFFGIHSPSTVFRDEIGKNLALGLGEGFTKELDSISDDMNNAIPTEFTMDYNVKRNITDSFGENKILGDLIDYNKLANAIKSLNMVVVMDNKVIGNIADERIKEAYG